MYLILAGIEELDAVKVRLSILVCFSVEGIAKNEEALACLGALINLPNEAVNFPGVLASGDEAKYSDDPLPDINPLIFWNNEVVLREE